MVLLLLGLEDFGIATLDFTQAFHQTSFLQVLLTVDKPRRLQLTMARCDVVAVLCGMSVITGACQGEFIATLILSFYCDLW